MPSNMHRREFIKATATLGLASATASCHPEPRWMAGAYRKHSQSRVAILRATSYQQNLTSLIVDGIRTFELPVKGKRILLKPNLVEYEIDNVINTHPAVVGAAIWAFRQMGAAEVKVGEGPGHRRDTDGLLLASGLLPFLKDAGQERCQNPRIDETLFRGNER